MSKTKNIAQYIENPELLKRIPNLEIRDKIIVEVNTRPEVI